MSAPTARILGFVNGEAQKVYGFAEDILHSDGISAEEHITNLANGKANLDANGHIPAGEISFFEHDVEGAKIVLGVNNTLTAGGGLNQISGNDNIIDGQGGGNNIGAAASNRVTDAGGATFVDGFNNVIERSGGSTIGGFGNTIADSGGCHIGPGSGNSIEACGGCVSSGSGNQILGASSSHAFGSGNLIGAALSPATGCLAVGTANQAGGTAASVIGASGHASHIQAMLLCPNEPGAAPVGSVSADSIQLGHPGITPVAYAPLSVVVDSENVTDAQELRYDALEFINALAPKQYRMDFKSDYTTLREITDEEFSRLTPYDRRHRVITEHIYAFDGTRIEWTRRPNIFKTVGRPVPGYDEALAQYRKDRGDTPKTIEVCKVRLLQTVGERDGSKVRTRYHHGFLPEDVAAAAKGVEGLGDFAGVKHLAHHKDADGVPLGENQYALAYEELLAPMIKAIQQLSAKNAALEARLEAMA